MIRSKVPVSIDELGYDNYVLFGPKFTERVVHTEVSFLNKNFALSWSFSKIYDFSKIDKIKKNSKTRKN